jgi:hypothetical protein
MSVDRLGKNSLLEQVMALSLCIFFDLSPVQFESSLQIDESNRYRRTYTIFNCSIQGNALIERFKSIRLSARGRKTANRQNSVVGLP